MATVCACARRPPHFSCSGRCSGLGHPRRVPSLIILRPPRSTPGYARLRSAACVWGSSAPRSRPARSTMSSPRQRVVGEEGFASFWVSQIFSHARSRLSPWPAAGPGPRAGHQRRAHLPRHPMVMAQQALDQRPVEGGCAWVSASPIRSSSRGCSGCRSTSRCATCASTSRSCCRCYGARRSMSTASRTASGARCRSPAPRRLRSRSRHWVPRCSAWPDP